MMPRNIAYLRVSTLDQDLEKNKADILHLANEKNLGKVEFIQEKVSGKVSWRKRKIAQLLEELDKGDVILLSEFSRLASTPVGRSIQCWQLVPIIRLPGIPLLEEFQHYPIQEELMYLPCNLWRYRRIRSAYFIHIKPMIELLIGSLLLSVLHAIIPNHWLPLVSLSRAEWWSLPETLSITVLTAFAHSFSTIGLGIVIGLIGYQLAGQYEALAEIAAPLMLLAMGLLYLSLDFRHTPHHHFPEQATLRRKSKAALVVSLCIAMFFSPCLEMETYYLAAGTYGWKGIGLISVVYLIVTMAGITLMVWAGYQSLQKLRWHWLEHHEKKVTGILLILLGIFTFFIS